MTDKLKQDLKNIKDQKTDLHSHLKQVAAQLLLHQSPIQQIQAYSSNRRFNHSQEDFVFKVRQSYKHLKNYEQKNRALLNKLNSATEQQPQQPASIGYLPDLQDQAKLFEKFGIGFGEEQTYRLHKALSRFAMKKNAKQIRLWGKILGTEADYYVIEGQADSTQQAGEVSPQTEPKGTGANRLSFWVATELTGQWIQLPLITPVQMRTARQIKYTFTGDLNRPILSNPLFPGKQSHLLKCQLSRISTSCSLIPKGSLTLNAENPNEVDVPEQYVFPDVTTLALKQNWVYLHPSLLKNGRASLLKPQGLQPEQQEKWIKAQTAKDPSEPRLKSIVLDSQNWSLKSVNLDDVYRGIGKAGKTICKGTVGIKNLIWPGWVTIGNSQKISSIYVGYGHKAKQIYYPFAPQTVLTEKQDKQEYVVNE